MSAWLRAHLDALDTAVRHAAASPVATLLSIAALASALSLPLAAWVLLSGLERVGERFDAAPRLTVYLPKTAGVRERNAVEQAVRGRPGVKAARIVTKEEALAEIKASEGGAELLAGLPGNPLSDALVVTPADTARVGIDALRADLARLPGIAEIEVDGAWVERLDAIVRTVRVVAAGLALLLAVAVVAVTFNTVRLQVLTRARELEVAALFGATRPWLRRPFLHFGALQGFVAGAAAAGLALLFTTAVNRELGGLGSLAGTGSQLFGLGWEQALTVALLSAGLGWLGALLSVGRHAPEG
jgi:cell division transport system permease protein